MFSSLLLLVEVGKLVPWELVHNLDLDHDGSSLFSSIRQRAAIRVFPPSLQPSFPVSSSLPAASWFFLEETWDGSLTGSVLTRWPSHLRRARPSPRRWAALGRFPGAGLSFPLSFRRLLRGIFSPGPSASYFAPRAIDTRASYKCLTAHPS